MSEPLLPMDSVPARVPRVLSATLDDETVLYDVASGRPALLNITAAAVWAELDGRRTVEEIVTLLADRFASSREVVAAGVVETLSVLVDRGLVCLTS